MEPSPEIEKIIQFLSNDLDESENKLVRNWINESPENHKEFERIAHLWASYKKEPKFSVNAEADWKSIATRIHLPALNSIPGWKTPQMVWVYRVAATLIFGFAVWTSILLFPQQEKQIVYRSNNQNELLILNDSSRVWLNQNSTLIYPAKFGAKKREVILEGEAFFEVQKDEKKPFIIHSQNTSTTVLGTSFLVKSHLKADSIVVLLKTGKVLFESTDTKTILEPGDQVILDKKMNKTHKTVADFNDLAWHTHELRFEKTDLKEVVRCLNRVYGKNIVIESNAILKCRFTGFYKNERLDRIVDDIALALQLTVDQNTNKIILNGNGCQ
ncbi:anti-sigma factor [Cytophagales bacterium WSM2-2]|nr:anti-sigma factor [Cytophagales bacterium WSM2-2]